MSTSIPSFLRPFQQRVFEYIMQGRNVIVQAPTGSGKTRAALAPYLQNLAQQGDLLPHTCRYAVPMRVLANQFYHEFEETARKIDASAPTRLVQRYQEFGQEVVALQTGEFPQDPQFESALTFCTIDQLLAGFLAVPYGLGPRKANLNVGAVVGSYLVLDEFHLYPLMRGAKSVFGARTTALHMLRLLSSLTPFVLMTATFSTALLNELKTLLNAEIVTVTDEAELQDIAQGRTRVFHRSPAPMDAEAILAEHRQRDRNKCTLVICNTVLRAQSLFLQLKQAEAEGTRVVLLHSRFSAEDRRRLSEEVVRELGPKQWQNGLYLGRDIIVIATQVVEVGLDISVEVLHTENAPANSLIQRAGRCARFAHQQGHVHVYPLPDKDDGTAASTLPYNTDLCAATWKVLEGVDGRTVGFPEEQKLIDAVHTQEDKDLLEAYRKNKDEIHRLIFESYNTNARSISSRLIRDIEQVHILIHDEPKTAIEEAPWRWQTFGMHPDSLTSPKRWEALQQRGAKLGLDWICKEAKPLPPVDNTEKDDNVDNRQQALYTWDVVSNPELVKQALVIALPSQLARYDSELGFVLLDGQLDMEPNGYQSVELPDVTPSYEHMGSRRTSYQDHIAGLVRAYNTAIRNDIHYIARKLEKAMSLPAGTVDQAVRLAIACHDLGKLDRRWQQWALEWQTLLYAKKGWQDFELPSPSYCFAKTDNSYSKQYRDWQREVKTKRPNHACESVAIGRKLIGTSLGITRTAGKEHVPVLRAICGAIARHHTSQSSQHQSAHLNQHALQATTEAIAKALAGTQWRCDSSLLELCIDAGDDLAPPETSSPKITRPTADYEPSNELETWLYFVIVRALRLADQRAG